MYRKRHIISILMSVEMCVCVWINSVQWIFTLLQWMIFYTNFFDFEIFHFGFFDVWFFKEVGRMIGEWVGLGARKYYLGVEVGGRRGGEMEHRSGMKRCYGSGVHQSISQTAQNGGKSKWVWADVLWDLGRNSFTHQCLTVQYSVCMYTLYLVEQSWYYPKDLWILGVQK